MDTASVGALPQDPRVICPGVFLYGNAFCSRLSALPKATAIGGSRIALHSSGQIRVAQPQSAPKMLSGKTLTLVLAHYDVIIAGRKFAAHG